MLFVSPLTEAEEITLNEAYKYHPLSSTRMRAHCILLSNQHYQVKEIALICNVCRQTVSHSIRVWEQQGFCGLLDEKRSGRPKKLSKEQEIELLNKVAEQPHAIKQILSEFSERYQITISLDTLKRLCKNAKIG